jgi:hypothetical protein
MIICSYFERDYSFIGNLNGFACDLEVFSDVQDGLNAFILLYCHFFHFFSILFFYFLGIKDRIINFIQIL